MPDEAKSIVINLAKDVHELIYRKGYREKKRQTGWTERKIARYYKEGCGQGELGSYKPWLTIQGVSVSGCAYRAPYGPTYFKLVE
jgi:hypothetical protein